ncbi:MAG: ATP-binding protein [Planctomycetota bacterium]
MNFLKKPPSIEEEIIYCESIDSTIEAKDEFLESALPILEREASLSYDRMLDARLVLDELINNAIVHGNQKDGDTKVKITLFDASEGWAATIEDEGAGFTPEDISTDFDAIELTQTGGRGLALVEMYADELQYYNGGAGAYVQCSIGVTA